MKKYLSPIVCGFGAGVLMIAPLIKTFTCCLIIPAAALFSLLLDQKANPKEGEITIQKGLVFGLLTGVFAALFGTLFETLITFITHSNDLTENYEYLIEVWKNIPDEAMLKTTTDLFQKIISDIEVTGFSLTYSLLLFANHFFTGLIFGLLGGLLGMKIGNANLKKQQDDSN